MGYSCAPVVPSRVYVTAGDNSVGLLSSMISKHMTVVSLILRPTPATQSVVRVVGLGTRLDCSSCEFQVPCLGLTEGR